MATPLQKRKLMGEINVVPYIDVMLVLLVIFMVTAPLLTQGVQVDLPQAASSPIPESDVEPLILDVDSSGRYFIGDLEPLDAAAVVARDDARASEGGFRRPPLRRRQTPGTEPGPPRGYFVSFRTFSTFGAAFTRMFGPRLRAIDMLIASMAAFEQA